MRVALAAVRIGCPPHWRGGCRRHPRVILGYVRGGFPRVRLSLPGTAGPVALVAPSSTPASTASLRYRFPCFGSWMFGRDCATIIRLADGSIGRSAQGSKIGLNWDDELRLAMIRVLDGLPLIGVESSGRTLNALRDDGGRGSRHRAAVSGQGPAMICQPHIAGLSMPQACSDGCALRAPGPDATIPHSGQRERFTMAAVITDEVKERGG